MYLNQILFKTILEVLKTPDRWTWGSWSFDSHSVVLRWHFIFTLADPCRLCYFIVKCQFANVDDVFTLILCVSKIDFSSQGAWIWIYFVDSFVVCVATWPLFLLFNWWTHASSHGAWIWKCVYICSCFFSLAVVCVIV